MDNIDKKIINRIQADFPICSEPYKQLGKELGLTEGEVIQRLNTLKQKGYIRRLGAVFNSQKLGFSSTLLALKVPPARIDEVAEIINAYKGVTHNYLRQTDYNMWFTLTAESDERLSDTIAEIKEKTGISDLLNLPAIKLFKINVNFKFDA